MEPLLSSEDMLGNMAQEIEHLLSKVNIVNHFRILICYNSNVEIYILAVLCQRKTDRIQRK